VVHLENHKLNKKEAESRIKRIKEKRERGRIIISIVKKEEKSWTQKENKRRELVMEDNANKSRGLQLEQHIHIDCHKGPRRSQRVKSQLGEFPIIVKEQQTCHIPRIAKWGSDAPIG